MPSCANMLGVGGVELFAKELSKVANNELWTAVAGVSGLLYKTENYDGVAKEAIPLMERTVIPAIAGVLARVNSAVYEDKEVARQIYERPFRRHLQAEILGGALTGNLGDFREAMQTFFKHIAHDWRLARPIELIVSREVSRGLGEYDRDLRAVILYPNAIRNTLRKRGCPGKAQAEVISCSGHELAHVHQFMCGDCGGLLRERQRTRSMAVCVGGLLSTNPVLLTETGPGNFDTLYHQWLYRLNPIEVEANQAGAIAVEVNEGVLTNRF